MTPWLLCTLAMATELTARPGDDLQALVDQLGPGDTLTLTEGMYRLQQPLRVVAQGRPDAWITLRAAPGQTAVLDGSQSRPANGGEAGWGGLLEMERAQWIAVEGLVVQNSYRFGVRMNQCEGIDLRGLRVDNTFAPGIGAWNGRTLRVIGCEVTRATTNRLRLFGDPNREAPHEAISIAGIDGFEVCWNEVHHGDKEGIDVKEISANGVVHHNWAHHMPRQGLYVDAWFGLLHDVQFISNVSHDNEWGMAASVEGRGSTMRDVTFRHNLVFDNKASGFYLGTWGTDGVRSGLKVIHNTFFRNGRSVHWAGPTGNIDLRSKGLRDSLIANNLCVEGGAYQIASIFGPGDAHWTEAGNRVTHNLQHPKTDQTGAANPYGDPKVIFGEAPVFAPAEFVDAPNDLRLRDDSPGLGSGTDLAYTTDLGALPRGAVTLPKVESPLKGFAPYTPNVERFPAVIGRP